jgi:hypothetical protein
MVGFPDVEPVPVRRGWAEELLVFPSGVGDIPRGMRLERR